jgi:hypothetical protein
MIFTAAKIIFAIFVVALIILLIDIFGEAFSNKNELH